MEDQYTGCIHGLAIGDALGHPVEFLKSHQIRAKYGPLGITDFQPNHGHPPGTYTDDTQMTLALARALIAAGSADEETLMNEVARQFVDWERSPENNRAPGMTCMDACAKLARGVPWRKAGENHSKGCGTAMRSAPIGLLYHGDIARIVRVGSSSSLITHGHPCATAGSVATAYLVSLALDRTPPEEMIDRLLPVTAPISSNFNEAIEPIRRALALEPDDAFALLGEGWVAEQAVAAALYCFLRTPDDYRATVLTGANASGDCDSIACIAGAISGAYHGIQGIPGEWREQVENSSDLQQIGQQLFAAAALRAKSAG